MPIPPLTYLADDADHVAEGDDANEVQALVVVGHEEAVNLGLHKGFGNLEPPLIKCIQIKSFPRTSESVSVAHT